MRCMNVVDDCPVNVDDDCPLNVDDDCPLNVDDDGDDDDADDDDIVNIFAVVVFEHCFKMMTNLAITGSRFYVRFTVRDFGIALFDCFALTC